MVASNHTDTGLTNGVTYYYVVTAENTAGQESGNSSEASATPADVPPAAPLVWQRPPRTLKRLWTGTTTPSQTLQGTTHTGAPRKVVHTHRLTAPWWR